MSDTTATTSAGNTRPVSFRLGDLAVSQLDEIVSLSPHATDRTAVLRRLIAAEVARLRKAAARAEK